MSSKTADGLRERLFDALDAVIEKRIKKEDVESICYVSEQIIKTANVELEIMREQANLKREERLYQIEMKKQEKDSILMLKETLENIE